MIGPLILVAMLMGSAKPQCPRPMEIGARLKHLPRTDQVMMTNSAQLDPFIECTDGGITYSVAWSAESKRISYITTSDEHFESADRKRVNDTIEITPKDARVAPGWSIFWFPDKDGWAPIIGSLCFAASNSQTTNDGTMQYPCPELRSNKPLRVRILGFAKHRYWKSQTAK